MNVEFSVTSETAKTRVIDGLRSSGLAAASGPIRLAYPFSVSVDELAEGRLAEVTRLIHSVDPCAGLIVTATRAPVPAGA